MKLFVVFAVLGLAVAQVPVSRGLYGGIPRGLSYGRPLTRGPVNGPIVPRAPISLQVPRPVAPITLPAPSPVIIPPPAVARAPLTCPADSIANDQNNVCCPATCGTCGGVGCAQRPGGSDMCCRQIIQSEGTKCYDSNEAPCALERKSVPIAPVMPSPVRIGRVPSYFGGGRVVPRGPVRSPIAPRVTPIAPRVTPIAPRVTPISPRVTPISSRVTPISPRVAPLGIGSIGRVNTLYSGRGRVPAGRPLGGLYGGRRVGSIYGGPTLSQPHITRGR